MLGKLQLGVLIYIISGPLIWAAHLFVVYAAQSVACTFIAPPGPGVGNVVSVSVILATIAGAIATGWLCLRPSGVKASLFGNASHVSPSIFENSLMRLLAGLSLVGILWAGMAAMILPACGALR